MKDQKNQVHEVRLLQLAVILTITLAACGGGADTSGGRHASADLGPMAPAAEGKPLSVGIDGVELGMTAAEVTAAWGEPISDSYGTLEYRDRGGYQPVQVGTSRRDHGDVVWTMTLTPEDGRDKDQEMQRLIDQFGPPITDAKEAAMLRTIAVSIGESETLFRAGRYAHAVAQWDYVTEDKRVLSELQFALHPHAVFDVPRSDWPALQYPFPISLPDAAKAQLKELLESDGPDDPSATEFENLLGPPTWKHPGSLDREAWLYVFWDSQTALEFFFTDGALNGYQTQNLE